MTTRCATYLLAIVAASMGCSQHLVRTADGWQPPERLYRILALDSMGNLMPGAWNMTSHEPDGSELVRTEGDDNVDFRFARAGGELVAIRTIPIVEEHRNYPPQYFAEWLRVQLCTHEESGLSLTPLGWAWREKSLYFGYTTLSSQPIEVDHRPGFLTVIDRAGAGPVQERRFLIAAIHAPGEPSTLITTYGAPRDRFSVGADQVRDLVMRIRFW